MFTQSIKLFKLLGFEVKIDFSWIFIAILIIWSLSTGFFPLHVKNLSPATYWLMGVTGAVGLFFSIIIHEFSHSLVARKYGLPMKGITLFIFGGVAEMENDPASPKTEFLMAAAGPLSSFLIAFLFFITYTAGANLFPQPMNAVLQYLAFINALLAVFNLAPAFPLDGGRILRSALWKFKGNIRWATRISSSVGSTFGIVLIILGILNIIQGRFIGGMWWCLIGYFIYSAAKLSYQQLLTRRALDGEKVGRFMKTDPVTVSPNTSVDTFVNEYIYQFHYKMFPVVEPDEKLAGYVTTKQVKEVPREKWSATPVSEIVVQPDDETIISPEDDAMKALSIMSRTRQSRLLVIQNQRLMGVITLKDLLEFLSLKIDLDE